MTVKVKGKWVVQVRQHWQGDDELICEFICDSEDEAMAERKKQKNIMLAFALPGQYVTQPRPYNS